MRFQLGGDGSRESIAVDGQRAPSRKPVLLGHFHHQTARCAHFPMDQAHGIALVVVGAEGVRADHLGEVASAVGEGAGLGPHLVQDHGDAKVRGGPGGFGARHAAADDVQGFGHGADVALRGGRCKKGRCPFTLGYLGKDEGRFVRFR